MQTFIAESVLLQEETSPKVAADDPNSHRLQSFGEKLLHHASQQLMAVLIVLRQERSFVDVTATRIFPIGPIGDLTLGRAVLLQ